jgi:hypothetical protein
MGRRISWLAAACSIAFSACPSLATKHITEVAAAEVGYVQKEVFECAAFHNIMTQALTKPPQLAGWQDAVEQEAARRDELIHMGAVLTKLLGQEPEAAAVGYELANEKLGLEVKLNASNYSALLSRYAPTCSAIAEETTPKIVGWTAAALE